MSETHEWHVEKYAKLFAQLEKIKAENAALRAQIESASKQEPDAWEVTRTLATGSYDRIPLLFSSDPQEVQIGTRVIPLIPRPTIPAGYQLVPVEYQLVPVKPTFKMLLAMIEEWDSVGKRTAEDNYKAMLKVAKETI